MKNLDIYEDQIELGQVKTITTGSIVNFCELLLTKNTKAQFYFDEENDVIQINLSDTDLQISNLAGSISKDVLHDLIVSLKGLYGQLGKKQSTN